MVLFGGALDVQLDVVGHRGDEGLHAEVGALDLRSQVAAALLLLVARMLAAMEIGEREGDRPGHAEQGVDVGRAEIAVDDRGLVAEPAQHHGQVEREHVHPRFAEEAEGRALGVLRDQGLEGITYGHYGEGCIHLRVGFGLDKPGGKEEGGDGETGIHLRLVGGEALVVRVDEGSSGAQAGVKTGWVLEAANGKPLSAVIIGFCAVHQILRNFADVSRDYLVLRPARS